MEDFRNKYPVVNEAPPTAQAADRTASVDAFGNLLIRPAAGLKHDVLARMGAYYTVKTVQTTGVLGHAAATAYDATKPTIHLANTNYADETGGKHVYVDYVKLCVMVTGTNNTDQMYSVAVDRDSGSAGSNGTAYTPLNANLLSAATSGVTVRMGAVTAATASAYKRVIYQGYLRSAKVVLGDRYKINFGGNSPGLPGMLLASGGAQTHMVEHCGPWIIPPASIGMFHLQATAESVAPNFDIEVGYWVL